MSYRTPEALRTALEAHIRNESATSGISPDRLRRRVVIQRIVTRLQRAEPGRWVLKGGMAMEVRLHDAARLTKDLDLGLRETDVDPADLRERLIEALARDEDGDGFVFGVGVPAQMTEDGGGHLTWRVAVDVELAGRRFGAIKLDVSPRAHELDATDTVTLPNALDFAGFGTVEIEIVDIHRHAAEKLLGPRHLRWNSRTCPQAGPSATSVWRPRTRSIRLRSRPRPTERLRCGARCSGARQRSGAIAAIDSGE